MDKLMKIIEYLLCSGGLHGLSYYIFIITITADILLSSFYRGSPVNSSEPVNCKSGIKLSLYNSKGQYFSTMLA